MLSEFKLFMAGALVYLNVLLQIASGRHRLVTSALHRSTGAAAESANRWRKSNLFMKSAVKEMELSGVHYFKSVHLENSFLAKQACWKYTAAIKSWEAVSRIQMHKALHVDVIHVQNISSNLLWKTCRSWWQRRGAMQARREVFSNFNCWNVNLRKAMNSTCNLGRGRKWGYLFQCCLFSLFFVVVFCFIFLKEFWL